MKLTRSIKEGLIFLDRPAKRSTELVAHQVIADLRASIVREPIVGRVSLGPVVFKSRAMPLVGASLEHSVGNEATRLSVLSREIIRNDAVLLDGIWRNCCIRAARTL